MLDEPADYRPRVPLHVVWLATQACGLRCAHCSSDSGRAGRHELSTFEAMGLVDELAGAGVVDLAISGGEPLLRDDILPLIRRARKRGLSVGLGSSALGARRHLASLSAAGLERLQISLDGPPDLHDALRRRPGLHVIALDVIRLAVDAGLRVHVCCTVHAGNEHVIEHVVELAHRIGVKLVNFSRFIPTGRGTSALDMSPERWQRVIARCHAIRTAYAGRVQIVTHLAQQILIEPSLGAVPGFVGCQAGRGQGCVAADGTVWPCVMLPIPLGNVRERSFEDIWRSAGLVRDLGDRSLLKGACRDCLVRDRCGGCRAVAFARTGDVFAEDQRCWIAGRRDATPKPATT